MNPATGDRQFTLFMSPEQEKKIGAAEHEKIMQLFGGSVKDQKVINYVRDIGRKLVAGTELPAIKYKFYVLNTPVINAFALPGGYVYVSRGLVTLANSEAELASVIGHEIAHITARHSAERYSQSVLASLGTSVLASSVDMAGAGDIARLGSQLYLSSYSRDQESQADKLGIRYLARAGYDPLAAASFLESLDRHSALEQLDKGISGKGGFDFFSTHPKTENRVREAFELAFEKDKGGGTKGKDRHLDIIDGMIYGYGPSQGFVRSGKFVHPEMGFRFSIPKGFTVINNPSEIIALSENKGILIFDSDFIKQDMGPSIYLTQKWMESNRLNELQKIVINGRPAATASFPGTVRGKSVTIRVVAVKWGIGRFYRFMMAIPRTADEALLNEYKKTTYSLESISSERAPKALRIDVVRAGQGDNVERLARRMAISSHKERWFRVINGLSPSERLQSGHRYKIVAIPD